MFKFVDPTYWVLQLVLRSFMRTELTEGEGEFVAENITKHRISLWIALALIPCSIWGVREYQESTAVLVTALLGPVFVMGSAWFAISFGAIPAKLMDAAMVITFWMFTAFNVSLMTSMIAIGYLSPWQLWPAFGTIYVAAYAASVMYDTADGFKPGLDEAVLKHSRAALAFYAKQGIDPSAASDADDKDD